jgi:heme oxygenase
VALVVPEGGQAELVADGRTGAHWRTVPELVERTRALMAADLSPLRERAVAEAARYETGRFRRAVRERVLTPPPR